MLAPFETTDFNTQLSRTLGKASIRAACLGECLQAAASIVDGDLESWLGAWMSLADRLAAVGDACLAAGHTVSAGDAYRRAAEYYRQATFFHRVNLDNPHLQKGWRRAGECFRAAAAADGMDVTPVSIPFEGASLHGYYLRADPKAGPAPTVIAPSGYDGVAEEASMQTGFPALKRGYNALCFDGPGQGVTLYDPERRLFMRPDWENILPRVVDFALGLPGVDPDRLVASGMSFAGFLIPRGVAGEPRIAALIADPGQYDIGAALKARLPPALLDRLEEDSADADAAFEPLIRSREGAIMFLPRMAAHGCTTMRGYARDLMRFGMAGLAEKIGCPSLICDNESDVVSTGQGTLLARAIGDTAKMAIFTVADGTGDHCEILGREVFEQVAFDWLDEVLGR